MEVQFTPDVEKKLNELAAQSGRGSAATLVQDVVEGYFDELAQTREILNSRYDDLKSGRVKPIPGDEIEAYFAERKAPRRVGPNDLMTGIRLPPGRPSDLDEIWEFIRQTILDAADRVIAEILATIRGLVPFPNQGHKRPDLTGRPLRFILVREYLIAYAPEEKPLWVVAVMHGRRSTRVMAAILRGREM